MSGARGDAMAHDGQPVPLDLDVRGPTRLGYGVLVLGFAVFLGWSAWAPLDRGVAAPGTVIVSGHRKAVQPARDGMLARILVREGDAVEAGQVLARIDDTQARADMESTQVQYINALAAEARLAAERDGLASVVFPDALRGLDAVRVQDAVQAQRQLFAARREAQASEQRAMEEAIAAYEAELEGVLRTVQARQAQVGALREQLASVRRMVDEGYAPRNRQLELERMQGEAEADLASFHGRRQQLVRQIAEQRLRLVQQRQHYQSAVREQRAQTAVQAQALRDQLHGARHDLVQRVLTAPVAGTVVGMAVFTEGGFVRAGERLMDIVPQGEGLLVEGRIPVDLIDVVHAGLPVDVLFPAFNLSRTPRLTGRLATVGADRLVDAATGMPYYPVQVDIEARELESLSGQTLRPGMSAQVFVRTGERSLLSYLFKPLLDRAGTALTER